MTKDFFFEDLPLSIMDGYELAPVNGTAAISYHRDGEWSIDRLWLDGSRKATAQERAANKSCWINKPVELDAGTPIYLAIYDRLESEWRDRVDDFVSQMIAEDLETGRESLAQFRMEAAE